ncbi:YlbF family regulator [Selenomonadales bacterium OttesenSCG-928-I06]|nr:YlbF family regulator [Selenomonadales bacterium OttesenSCG-928-I06]
MNVYDKVHELSRMIKEGPEYSKLLAAKETLDKDESVKNMVRDFFKAQVELERATMMGEEQNPETVEKMKSLRELINLNTAARDFLIAHMTLMQLAGDVYKIIGDTFSDLAEMDIFKE